MQIIQHPTAQEPFHLGSEQQPLPLVQQVSDREQQLPSGQHCLPASQQVEKKPIGQQKPLQQLPSAQQALGLDSHVAAQQ